MSAGRAPRSLPRAAEPGGPTVQCEHAECPGCPLIGLPYAEQLDTKKQRVIEALSGYASLAETRVDPVDPAEPITGYRTRAKLIVGPGGTIGLYAQGKEHRVVDVPGCRVISPALARVAGDLRKRVAAEETFGGVMAPATASGGMLRAVDLREVRDGDGPARVLLTLVVDAKAAARIPALRESAEELLGSVPGLIGVAANFHHGRSPQVLGPETTLLAGVQTAPDRVGASRHVATYGSFVQAHRAQAAKIHARVARAVSRGAAARPRVLDLYAGSGAIGLALAAAGASVKLVESFAPAVDQARAAAREQGLHIEAECADAESSVRRLAEHADSAPYDAAVVNPPRRGISPTVRDGLARLGVGRVVYVSCDPGTLARDLDHLARLGYRAAAVQPFDMIPLTEEVETVAVLERGPLPAPAVLYENDEILVVDKGPHEPTVPQREFTTSLTDRVRTLQGAETAVAVHRLETHASGLVVFARQAAVAATWSRALAAPGAHAVHTVAVKGVLRAAGSVSRPVHDRGRNYPARTRYRRVDVVAGHTLVEVTPDPGRPGQIGFHMASIRHPVLGDPRHGDPPTNRHYVEKHGLDRAFIHRARLELHDPRTGEPITVSSPLPGDLRAVLDQIG
jgi:23S rRNA (uracil1939-C5)-methyltransferase